MLASRQSEVCERNTRVDMRAGCAHCGVPTRPGGATRHPYEHGVERAHSHRLIAIADPHRLRLVTCKANEDHKRLSGKVPSQLVRRCSYARSPECTSSIMEPGVANREGKGAIKRRRMRKVILQNSGNPPDADHKVRAAHEGVAEGGREASPLEERLEER